MFYIFYIGNLYEFQALKDIVIKILGTGTYGEVEVLDDSDSEVEVVSDYFTLSIDNYSESIRNTSEDYKIDLVYRFWFEMDTNQNDIIEKLMKFIGECIARLEGQGILFSNGDTPIMIMNNKKIVVDDTKLNGVEKFPFEEMEISFERGEI